jgi:hypothetical protein
VSLIGTAAQAVRKETYHLAHQFLAALPLGLTFEWYGSPQRTLSVSVSPDGDLHYAALVGSAKAWGTDPFFGEIPKVIDTLIRRLTNT